jgi:hypothetical protein
MTEALSNKLRYRLTRYFRAYYKTLRREIEKATESGTDPDSIPHYYKGHKRVQTILCRDGVLIVHYPADEGSSRDEFEFYAPPGPLPTVKESAAAYNPPLPGGDVLDPLVDYEPGEHFGPVVYVEPRQRVTVMGEEGGDGAEVIEQDKWHRLDMVSWSRVEAYFDEAVAKSQARYVFATRHRRRGPEAPKDFAGATLPPVVATGDLAGHPIREILRTREPATGEEAGRILGRIAGAPFMGEVKIPPRHRGLHYRGREVRAKEDSLFYHLAKRVDEGQWAEGTTEEEYLEDLHSAAQDPSAQLILYTLRGGVVAAVVSDNPVPEGRRGPDALEYLFVAYSADRATIITGYQVSGVETLKLSEDPLWLR